MNCACGAYTNATVNGVYGGRVPVCDDCLTNPPDPVYRPPSEIAHGQPTSGRPVGRPRTVITEPIHTQPKGQVMPSAAVHTGVPAGPEGRVSVINAPVVLTLPECPSANRYYRRHGVTMHRSREAKQYVEAVAQLAAPYRVNDVPTFPTGDVSVVVTWHRSAKRGDLPNRTKVLYDALQGTLYADDAQIVQEWTRRVDAHEQIPKGFMRVEVSPA